MLQVIPPPAEKGYISTSWFAGPTVLFAGIITKKFSELPEK